MERYDITRNIETFDPDIPCKGCLIKMVCSKFCEEWWERINSTWSDQLCDNVSQWIQDFKVSESFWREKRK